MIDDRLKKIKNQVEIIVEETLKNSPFELVKVSYQREYGRWVLRIYIDKVGGITLDDCVDLSKEISQLLDVEDIIPHSYTLEVSSPGLNRPLVKEKDFKYYKGRLVKIKTEKMIENRKNFKGYLVDIIDGVVKIDISGKILSIPLVDISHANLEPDFNNLPNS